MFKNLWRLVAPNPLDILLKKAQRQGHKRFLLVWNRGLGDIALGLYAIVHRIRSIIPDAHIAFLTRANLEEGFVLLGGVEILVAPSLKRGEKRELSELLNEVGRSFEDYDVFIEHPDPTYWVKWQLGSLTPLLKWNPKWEENWQKFPLEEGKKYIGVHVHAETSYATWRNWPMDRFEALFKTITARGDEILLFGFAPIPLFSQEGVIDLRGKTESLYDLLSIIKNCCKALIVPDSGVSSMTYFLDTTFPLKIVSLWADPYMGILKQNVTSPNPQLQHIPLIGADKQIQNIQVSDVEKALY